MITYPIQIDTPSTIAIAVNKQTYVTAEIYNTLRSAVIAIENELGINPSQEFETVRERIDSLSNTITILSNLAQLQGTPNPIPNTYAVRDSLADCGFNSIELNANGELRFITSTTEVTAIQMDTSNNIQIGDALDAESMTLIVGPNKNIITYISGTGNFIIDANGLTSQAIIYSNNNDIFHIKAGGLSLFGSTESTTGIRLPNTQNGTIDIDSIASSIGRHLSISSGNVTSGGAPGGDLNFISGTSVGGETGNITNILSIGSDSETGNYQLNDGSNNFLIWKATTLFTSMMSDRAISMTSEGEFVIAAFAVTSGDGHDIAISGGNVNSGAGQGGDITLTAGNNIGNILNTTGTIKFVVPIGGPVTGNIDLNDGINNFLRINATTVQAVMASDRDLRIQSPTLLLSANTTLSLAENGNNITTKITNSIPYIGAINEQTDQTTYVDIGELLFNPNNNNPGTSTTRTIKFIAIIYVSTIGQTATINLHNETDAIDVATLTSTSTTPEKKEITLIVPTDLPNAEKIYSINLKRTGGIDPVYCKIASIEVFFT